MKLLLGLRKAVRLMSYVPRHVIKNCPCVNVSTRYRTHCNFFAVVRPSLTYICSKNLALSAEFTQQNKI